MNYVKSFDLFGVPARQIPATPGNGAPTTTTEGAVGCLYMDTDTGDLYKCTAVSDGVYTWVEAGNSENVDLTGVVKSINGETPDENGNVEIVIPDSTHVQMTVDADGNATFTPFDLTETATLVGGDA